MRDVTCSCKLLGLCYSRRPASILSLQVSLRVATLQRRDENLAPNHLVQKTELMFEKLWPCIGIMQVIHHPNFLAQQLSSSLQVPL